MHSHAFIRPLDAARRALRAQCLRNEQIKTNPSRGSRIRIIGLHIASFLSLITYSLLINLVNVVYQLSKMPLYNNILLSKKNDNKDEKAAKTNPSPSMKLLQDHLQSKRRLQQQNSSLKAQKLADKSTESKSSNIISVSTLHRPSENDWDPDEEYDPMLPNSYELLQTEYLKAAEQRLSERKLASSNQKIPISNLMDVMDKLDDESEYSNQSKKTKGTAIAPPPSLLNSTSANTPTKDSQISDKTCTMDSSEKLESGSSFAAKIMSKMGYKAGQGLGKDEQGISSPLEVEKSGLNSGRILPAPKSNQKVTFDVPEDTVPELTVAKYEPKTPENKMADLLRESTRVLLLQNMVGPGEVDDDLEAETKEECKKYGDVVKCLIYEIPNKKVPDSEAVRIFVEFRKVESAIKAASDLNGRYFGGRVVRASFYSLDKFNRYELAPG